MKSMRLRSGQFFGDAPCTWQIAGFTYTESRYTCNASLPLHAHEQAYFSVLLHGSYTERVRSRIRDCQREIALFHPAEESHSDRFHSAGGQIFNVEFSGEWFDRLHGHGLDTHAPIEFRGIVPNLGRRLHAHLRRPSYSSPLHVEALTLEMLAQLPSRKQAITERRLPGWLVVICDYLHDHYMESVSLRTVCDLVNIHPTHVARTFKRFKGYTISEYVRRLRVHQACDRLVGSSSDRIADIASSLGFSDQSHFCRQFKQVMRVNPSTYRKISR